MTKLKRDARAFATRVWMGQSRVWLLVEGRVTDRPFYERLLESHPQAASEKFSIKLAEEIELDGRSGGGKPFALKLFDFFHDEGLLVQQANDGPRTIGFALDRDLDHVSGEMRDSKFVFYTEHADSEAEILFNGDLRRAVGSALSLDSERIEEALPAGESLGTTLAELWRDWITYGAVAVGCSVQSEFRYGKPSKINVGIYGPVDELEREKLRTTLEDRLSSEGRLSEFSQIEAKIMTTFNAGQGHALVKGKWLATYVEHRVRVTLSDIPVEAGTQAGTITKTCLETLDFGDAWATPFRLFIDDLLLAA